MTTAASRTTLQSACATQHPQRTPRRTPSKSKNKNKNKDLVHKYETKPQKFSHKDLVRQNVIVDVDEQVLKQTKANFNNLVYYFKQIGPDEFEVEVKYKVGFGAKISPFPEPFQLS